MAGDPVSEEAQVAAAQMAIRLLRRGGGGRAPVTEQLARQSWEAIADAWLEVMRGREARTDAS